MRRTLTRELPSAKAIRAMLGAAPVQSDKPPALERRAADRDSMPHEYARVVALSRVKGGRIAHVSQVVGDLVLRVPNVTNESAFALEVIVTTPSPTVSPPPRPPVAPTLAPTVAQIVAQTAAQTVAPTATRGSDTVDAAHRLSGVSAALLVLALAA